MKASHKKWSPSAPIETRYRKARQEWDTRMGGALSQARNWRLATLLSLGLVLLALVGLVYLGAQPKAVPHIVQVDRIGAPLYAGPVGQSARSFHPPDATIRYHLRRFIEQTRGISSDRAILQRNWREAYASITPTAANQLTGYVEKNDPIKRAEKERVTVDVVATVQLSADTWQVDWEEKAWDKSGAQLSSAVWRGNFRVIVRPPETEEQIAANPLGIYVDEFHWSRVQV